MSMSSTGTRCNTAPALLCRVYFFHHPSLISILPERSSKCSNCTASMSQRHPTDLQERKQLVLQFPLVNERVTEHRVKCRGLLLFGIVDRALRSFVVVNHVGG